MTEIIENDGKNRPEIAKDGKRPRKQRGKVAKRNLKRPRNTAMHTYCDVLPDVRNSLNPSCVKPNRSSAALLQKTDRFRGPCNGDEFTTRKTGMGVFHSDTFTHLSTTQHRNHGEACKT
jgi:hypothetical protein